MQWTYTHPRRDNQPSQDFSTRVVELETALSACEARARQLEDQVAL